MKEDFYGHFELQIDNIKRLSDVIHREAFSGLGGEVRVTRHHVEAIHKDINDLRVGLEGIARRQAEEKHREEIFRHSLQGESVKNEQLRLEALSRLGTAAKHLLGDLAVNQLIEQAIHQNDDLRQSRLAPRRPCDLERLVLVDEGDELPVTGQDNGQAERIVRRDDVVLSSSHMETSFDRRQILAGLEPGEDLFVDQRVISIIQERILDPKAAALCIAGPILYAKETIGTSLAAKIVSSMARSGIPIISYCCKLRRSRRSLDSREEEQFMALTYALIRQLIEFLLPQFAAEIDLGRRRFEGLDGTFRTWPAAHSI